MRKFVYLTLMAAFSFLALAMAMLPQIALAPNKDHTSSDIARAFDIGRVAPVATMLLALMASVLAILVWRAPRRPGRGRAILTGFLLVVLVAPALFATVLSRSSFAERMFPSLDVESVATADEAGIEDDALVMGIEVGGEARAYPVKIVGYHHIIHDEVGGQAVVATY